MPTQKLTETLLKSVDRPECGTVRYWDSEIKGFVAHVQKTTTTLYYDRDNRRHLIGKFPTVRLDRAREAARDLDFRLRRGYARHVTQSNPMIGDMLDQYCSRPTLRSEKYRKAVRHALEIDLKWANKRALDITPEMCRDAHQRLGKSGACRRQQCAPVLQHGLELRPAGSIATCRNRQALAWSGSRRRRPSMPRSVTWQPGRGRSTRSSNPVHRAAYMFGLLTGLRRSEIENSRVGPGRGRAVLPADEGGAGVLAAACRCSSPHPPVGPGARSPLGVSVLWRNRPYRLLGPQERARHPPFAPAYLRHRRRRGGRSGRSHGAPAEPCVQDDHRTALCEAEAGFSALGDGAGGRGVGEAVARQRSRLVAIRAAVRG